MQEPGGGRARRFARSDPPNVPAMLRLGRVNLEVRMSKPRVLAACILLAAAAARADPGYYLVTVYESEGEKSIDLRYWSVKFPGSAAVIWPEIGFGYGVTKRWYTELYASFIGSRDMATRLSTWNWQNDVLLTQGQYDYDLALHTNLITNHDAADGYAVEVGPVVQTDVGRTQLNANIFFERNFHSAAPSQTQLKYQWQAKYRWKPWLRFGLQGFGELGRWDDWLPREQQSHRAGPAISGSWMLGAEQALKYEAAYLFGSTYGSQGNMFSMRIQYVF
jgi:hypothetical protein